MKIDNEQIDSKLKPAVIEFVVGSVKAKNMLIKKLNQN